MGKIKCLLYVWCLVSYSPLCCHLAAVLLLAILLFMGWLMSWLMVFVVVVVEAYPVDRKQQYGGAS